MGLLGLFSGGKLSASKIKKVAELAANPFAQTDVRMKEMQRLLDDGSPTALRGLLKRFASNAAGHIADEEEKTWLEDELVDLGEPALAPLQDYIRQGDKLTYALRAYVGIAGGEAARRFFLEVLEAYGPDDYRAVEAKLQLVLQLVEGIDATVLTRLVPFLRDHSDDVSCAVMEQLEKADAAGTLDAPTRAAAAEKLSQVVLVDIGAPRVQKRAAELLGARAWSIPGEQESLVPILAEDYFLDKKRFVRRRARKANS